MTALAHQLARLIGPLHLNAPFEIKRRAEGLLGHVTSVRTAGGEVMEAGKARGGKTVRLIGAEAAESQFAAVPGKARMAGSAPEIEPDIEARRTVGQPAGGDEIDTAFGDGRGGLGGDPAGGFGDGAALHQSDGLAEHFGRHIVE
jgi:hypothetical protein